MIILETPRLLLRTLNVADARHFFLLNSDPEVMKYTGDKPFASVSEAEVFLEKYSEVYQKYGYARWALIKKDTEEFVGWSGLKFSPELSETDLGYRLFRNFWKNGYATESAAACVEYGFQKLQLSQIIGRVMPDNVASVNVLQKTGFSDTGANNEEGMNIFLRKRG